MLAWLDDDRFVVGETTFRVLPDGVFAPASTGPADGEFFIAKPHSLVEQYARLLDSLKPRHVLELGTGQGGSALFFAEFARPRRVTSVDREPLLETSQRVESHIAPGDLADVLRIHGGVNQADPSRLNHIVSEAFDDAPLDLVVDDCSHMYEPTRASFNELFPRLRPGGAYVIEAWAWAHAPLGSELSEGLFPGDVPVTQLLFEIALAIPGVPGLISGISIEHALVVIGRGDLDIEPGSFDVSLLEPARTCSLGDKNQSVGV